MTSDESAITAVIDAWANATQRGDIDAVLALMTEDVVFLVPGQPPMRGRQQFAAAFRGLPPGMQFSAERRIEEIVVAGDVAYTRLHLRVTMTPQSGEPRRRSGYVMSVYRRGVDGRWALARDVNLLAPEPPTA